MSTDAITALVILGLGLLFGGFAIFAGIDSIRQQKRTEQTETEYVRGTVAAIDRIRKQNMYARGAPVTHYKPVIRFQAGEKEYTLQYGISMKSPDERAVGDPVDICYDPRDPEKFHIAGDETNGRLGKKAVVIGIVIILIAGFWAAGQYFGPSLFFRTGIQEGP